MDQAAADPPSEVWRSVDVATADEGTPEIDPHTGQRLVALGILATLCVLAAVALMALGPSSSGAIVVGATDDPAGSAAALRDDATSGGAGTPGGWMIDVAGAVAKPGVYPLPSGSRVADAIRAAGGFGPQVDATAVAETLNLAEPLHDGQKLLVPQRGSMSRPRATGSPGTGTAPGQTQINLNRASASELDTLPGIGPVTAAKIIAAREERPFNTVDDLVARKVVSASVLAKIRALVTAGD